MADDALANILGGAVSGAATGSSMGPYGAIIGAAGGALVSGLAQSKKGDTPSYSDPMQTARLSRLERTIKQLSTGTDPLTQFNINETNRANQVAQRNIAKVTGGDVGGTLSAFRRAQKSTETNINRNVAEAAQRIPFFENASGMLANRIEDRKLQLQLLDRAQANAESAQLQTDMGQNSLALLATSGSMGAPVGDQVNTGAVNAGVSNQGIQLPQNFGQTPPAPQLLIEDPSVGNVPGITTNGYNYYTG